PSVLLRYRSLTLTSLSRCGFMGKTKKGVYPSPTGGGIHAYVIVCGHKKKSGYRLPDRSDSDTRSMSFTILILYRWGALSSLRCPCACFVLCFGSKNRTNFTKPCVFKAL